MPLTKTLPSLSLRRRIGALFAGLIAANIGVWVWAFSLFHAQPLMLGTAVLAWGLGLRHAVDADHIAAIDNVTRKLMQDGQRPVSVGFWFAIGHSGIIAIASIIIAVTASALSQFGAFKEIGGVIATVISALFLFTIAGMNLVILRSVWRTLPMFVQAAAMPRTILICYWVGAVCFPDCSGRCSAS